MFGFDSMFSFCVAYTVLTCNMFVTCIYCLSPSPSAFRKYSRGHIRLVRCKECHKLVDPYVEFDPLLLSLDLVLLSKSAWRHLLFNRLPRIPATLPPLLLLLLLIFLAQTLTKTLTYFDFRAQAGLRVPEIDALRRLLRYLMRQDDSLPLQDGEGGEWGNGGMLLPAVASIATIGWFFACSVLEFAVFLAIIVSGVIGVRGEGGGGGVGGIAGSLLATGEKCGVELWGEGRWKKRGSGWWEKWKGILVVVLAVTASLIASSFFRFFIVISAFWEFQVEMAVVANLLTLITNTLALKTAFHLPLQAAAALVFLAAAGIAAVRLSLFATDLLFAPMTLL